MTPDDFKKLLEEALRPINKRLEGIEGQLNDPESGLAALNRKMDSGTGAVVELESTIKAYGDMYKINNSNSKKLEQRIEVLEDKAGVIPPQEHTLVDAP